MCVQGKGAERALSPVLDSSVTRPYTRARRDSVVRIVARAFARKKRFTSMLERNTKAYQLTNVLKPAVPKLSTPNLL
jgi:hypothetical protein